jgi:spermidine synthase
LALLIGGLGLGLTLRAALSDSRVGSVHVVEIEPDVVRWNHEVLTEVNGNALSDPRVTVEVGDVRDALSGPPRRFDAILLDVDNGPGAVTRVDNAPLYDRRSLTAFRRSLRRPGVLGVWSDREAPSFAADLAAVFEEVRQVAIDSGSVPTRRLGPDILYCATAR